MFLVRDVMYCKPGMVRPMVDKFRAVSELSVKLGMPKMRLMTDVSAEQYWTVVAEMEVESLSAWEGMMSSPQGTQEDMKKFEAAMQGYHDLVVRGRREIYRLES